MLSQPSYSLAPARALGYKSPVKLRLYTAQIVRLYPDATRALLRLLLATRRAVLKAVPDCNEFIKWGALSYQKPDPDRAIKGGVCQVSFYRGQVMIGFVHGAFLPDPAGMLQGAAKAKRNLFVPGPAFLKDPRLLALLRASARFDPCHP